ncbi:LOW QUALITY PROTEIN: hypothetical protein N665_0021s0020 [Sinapis alba]|nr:LOW QUALITY PROTEIN: hypothetical protein N665_0021s0020 [Sinapis alba]
MANMLFRFVPSWTAEGLSLSGSTSIRSSPPNRYARFVAASLSTSVFCLLSIDTRSPSIFLLLVRRYNFLLSSSRFFLFDASKLRLSSSPLLLQETTNRTHDSLRGSLPLIGSRKPDLLAFVRHVLCDTKEFEYIKDSCFGQLFELPTRQFPVSCKLIHTLLTRQLICDDKHTLYPENPSGPLKDSYWFKLIGKKKSTTIVELRSKLENEANMPCWKKLRLALLIIVDGVLIAHQQTPRPTPRYVEMLKDVDAFWSHPWGRESFLKAITCMKPPKFVPLKCEDPIAIPLLQSQIAVPSDNTAVTILELDEPHPPIFPTLSKTDILRMEANPNLIPPHTTMISDSNLLHKLQLKVTSLIPVHSQPQPGWEIWPDVYDDTRLSFMEKLIADHQPFKKTQWPGGVTTEPFIIYPSPHDKSVPKKRSCSMKHQTQPHLKTRTTPKKGTTPQKQRHISSYFLRTGSSSNSNDEVLEMISVLTNKITVLEEETKRLRKLIKRRKTRTHSKHSSFHSLISRSKKFYKSDKGCQTDDIRSNKHDVPIEEGKPPCHSPVVSQYAAEHYRSPIHTTSIHASPVHTSPVHTSPIHTSPIHTSTIHTSTVHASPFRLSSYHTTLLSPLPPTQPYEQPLQSQYQHFLILHPLYPLRLLIARPLNLHESPSNSPSRSSLQAVIFGDVEIHFPISPDTQTPTLPKYDSSTLPASYPPKNMTISPLLYTPETSPNKSSENVFGFAVHASSVNAFAATVISNPVPKDTDTNIQAPFTPDDCVELSDGSPAMPTPGHIPILDESHIAKEIVRYHKFNGIFSKESFHLLSKCESMGTFKVNYIHLFDGV